ncbi:MAG TPA: heme biosynthesis HemY N-terminal domain-containing protein [Rickettsiales bacterium]|nr:heme biosynthesis HemY N-terminal domain-containing protein [Rickettsiales bacterium]
MWRIILILLIIAFLSLGVAWLADTPGIVTVDWGSYHLETSLPMLLAIVASTALLFMLIYTLVLTLLYTPRHWAHSRLAGRQMRGIEAMTAAFAALATSDLRQARKQVLRAQQYLPHQPLPLMLAAQLARMEGNDSKARLYTEKMLGNEVTEAMALRHLIENTRNADDHATALTYAEKALALNPKDTGMIATLCELYVKTGNPSRAKHLLEHSLQRRYIDKKFFRQESARILCEEAKQLMEQRRTDAAIIQLKESLSRQPELTEAAVLLAEILIARNESEKAFAILAKSWKYAPHASLRETLVRLGENEQNRKKFISSLQKIAKIHPEHEESELLLRDINNTAG